MAFKIAETRIWSNDRLVKYDDGSFTYHDTYGDQTDFPSSDALYSWLAEDGVEIEPELEAFIED